MDVFLPLTSAEACEKSSRWLWKESCVGTGMRKPRNMCIIDRHDMTLAVKVAFNPNATNQPYLFIYHGHLIPIWTVPPLNLLVMLRGIVDDTGQNFH